MARMIVPRHWAEARLQERRKDRQVTVRRWGWSDVGPEQARAHADERAREALARLLAGEPLPRREPKVPYNGAEGVPIREEIVSRHSDAVVTRNAYGALCLNTPDVGFVDVDFAFPPLRCGPILLAAAAAAVAAALLLPGRRGPGAFVAGTAALILLPLAVSLLRQARVRLGGGWEVFALNRVRGFARRRSDGRFRVYRTPAGLRVLVLHRTLDPTSAETAELFRELGADPIYARMCLRQHCFRARVSPKPWRIGIPGRLKPRPGVWPVNPEHLPERTRWLEAYDAASEGFASCHFLEALGDGPECPAARDVRELHDELSRAVSSLPLA